MIYTLRRYVGKSLACQCLTAVLASAASTSSRGDGEDLSAELLDEFLRNDLPEEEKVLTRLEYKKFECFPHNCTVLSTETITESADRDKIEIKLYVPGVEVQYTKLLGIVPIKSTRYIEAKNCSPPSLRCTDSGLRLRFILYGKDQKREPCEYVIRKLPADIFPDKSKARFIKDNAVIEIYKRTVVSWRRFYENGRLDQEQQDNVPSTESSSEDESYKQKNKKQQRKIKLRSSQNHEEADSGNEE